MRAYLDTGIFIDYLIGRSHVGRFLRTTDRRGRAPAQLGADAEDCLTRLEKFHSSVTSSLTCYEAEEAMYRELRRQASGVAHGAQFVVPAARVVMTQALMIIDRFHIHLADLTAQVVRSQCRNIDLQMRGVRAADALHVTTALAEGTDILISADDDVISLDSIFQAASGAPLRCVDTDVARTLL